LYVSSAFSVNRLFTSVSVPSRIAFMRPGTVSPEATSERRTCLKKNGRRYIDSISTGIAFGLFSLPSAMIAAPCISGRAGLNSSRMIVLSTETAPGSPSSPSDRIAWTRSCLTSALSVGLFAAAVSTSSAPSTLEAPSASAASRALSIDRGLAGSTSSIALRRIGSDLSHAAGRSLPLFL
jgi:hypothetical protein